MQRSMYLFQVTYDGNVTLLTQAIYLSKCTIGTVQPPSCLHCFKEKFSRDVFNVNIIRSLHSICTNADGFQHIFSIFVKLVSKKVQSFCVLPHPNHFQILKIFKQTLRRSKGGLNWKKSRKSESLLLFWNTFKKVWAFWEVFMLSQRNEKWCDFGKYFRKFCLNVTTHLYVTYSGHCKVGQLFSRCDLLSLRCSAVWAQIRLLDHGGHEGAYKFSWHRPFNKTRIIFCIIYEGVFVFRSICRLVVSTGREFWVSTLPQVRSKRIEGWVTKDRLCPFTAVACLQRLTSTQRQLAPLSRIRCHTITWITSSPRLFQLIHAEQDSEKPVFFFVMSRFGLILNLLSLCCCTTVCVIIYCASGFFSFKNLY